MGAIYNILAIRVKNPQLFADFEDEYGQTPPTAQAFVIVRDSRDYPENLTRRSWRPWGALEPSRRYGEAIFMFYYNMAPQSCAAPCYTNTRLTAPLCVRLATAPNYGLGKSQTRNV